MSTDLAVRDEPTGQLAPIGDPRAHVAAYTAVADELANIVRVKKLATSISGRDHVRVEGWTLLGSMLGVFPVTVWTREMRDDDGAQRGWEARVEARTRDGSIVGAAEAECMRSEKTWRGREDYALRSMAQTRATSKALRQPLGFVMTLAGFDPTPAEEMPRPARAPRQSGSGGAPDPRSAPAAAGSRPAPESGTARTGRRAEPTPPPAPDEVLEGEVIDPPGQFEAPTISEAQMRMIHAVVRELDDNAAPIPTEYKDREQPEGLTGWTAVLRLRLGDMGVSSRKDLTKRQAGDLIDWLEAQRVPFS